MVKTDVNMQAGLARAKSAGASARSSARIPNQATRANLAGALGRTSGGQINPAQGGRKNAGTIPDPIIKNSNGVGEGLNLAVLQQKASVLRQDGAFSNDHAGVIGQGLVQAQGDSAIATQAVDSLGNKILSHTAQGTQDKAQGQIARDQGHGEMDKGKKDKSAGMGQMLGAMMQIIGAIIAMLMDPEQGLQQLTQALQGLAAGSQQADQGNKEEGKGQEQAQQGLAQIAQANALLRAVPTLRRTQNDQANTNDLIRQAINIGTGGLSTQLGQSANLRNDENGVSTKIGNLAGNDINGNSDTTNNPNDPKKRNKINSPGFNSDNNLFANKQDKRNNDLRIRAVT